MSFIGKLVTKICSIRSSFGNYQELRQRNTCSFQDGHQLKRPNSCTKGKCSPRMHQLESRQNPGETFSEIWCMCWLLIFKKNVKNVQKDAKGFIGDYGSLAC